MLHERLAAIATAIPSQSCSQASCGWHLSYANYVVGSEDRFTLEFIDQSTGEIIVHCREFSRNGQTRANWSSDAATVNIERTELVYAYTCTVFHTKHRSRA